MKTALINTPEEKHEIEMLRCEVFHLKEIEPYYIQELLKGKEFAMATFDHNKKIIAGCYFHKFEEVLLIDQLFVKEEYQNTGLKIGRGLIENIFVNRKQLEELLGTELKLCKISAKNEKAKAIYKKIGFKESKVDSDVLIRGI